MATAFEDFYAAVDKLDLARAAGSNAELLAHMDVLNILTCEGRDHSVMAELVRLENARHAAAVERITDRCRAGRAEASKQLEHDLAFAHS
jgi:hypothetical protein